MAYYLVRARPLWEKLDQLREKLDAGEIVRMRPFGRSLDDSLRRARLEDKQIAIWEEEDYCRPPLAQERAAVLDHYFTDLTVTPVTAGQGWAQLDGLPSMWSRDDAES